jgi:hypothetical protein
MRQTWVKSIKLLSPPSNEMDHQMKSSIFSSTDSSDECFNVAASSGHVQWPTLIDAVLSVSNVKWSDHVMVLFIYGQFCQVHLIAALYR